MTHFVGLVVADNIEQVEELLSPFNEDLITRDKWTFIPNPNTKWDGYEIGGRWGNVTPDNICLGYQVRQYFHDDPPTVLIDHSGWHAEEEFGWFGESQPTNTPNIIEKKLEEHTDCTMYVVDFHGA